MEIQEYFHTLHSDKSKWIENNDKLFSILYQDHNYYLYQIPSIINENLELLNKSAIVIQRNLRKYVNKIIFGKIKTTLARYRFQNPANILRKKNIAEASLFDKVGGHFLLFRLNGETFPPTIVYKIYVNPSLARCSRYKIDVIPLNNKVNAATKSNAKWKVLYNYKRYRKPLEYLKKVSYARKQKHKRNKITWISNKYH